MIHTHLAPSRRIITAAGAMTSESCNASELLSLFISASLWVVRYLVLTRLHQTGPPVAGRICCMVNAGGKNTFVVTGVN